eukprot:gnl/TRDRNA2_/TRDRNA2_94745_c0_seq2.p1 gnl/TRDRNA2_/TRDRNA2_94745_c0~~gnl/TRDRNA2_/TRDRNA2_94745_c0_seq2.p1  ORF type:complete len:366 (-),score=113.34 gnl/TRDRNA2_/TRDRNA2_94745_c0_seq2:191-1258(-)
MTAAAKKKPQPKVKAKAKGLAKAPTKESIEDAEGKKKLENTLSEMCKCYDADGDGLIERVEFLDGEEKRAGPEKRFGPNERREAFKWFKAQLEEKDGMDPKDGMYLPFDKWKAAFTEKAIAESSIAAGEPGKLADWIWEEGGGKALVAACYKPDASEAGGAGGAASKGPPEYPLTCALKELNDALKEARKYGRNSLVLASGLDQVETFMSYQMYSAIDSKQILGEVLISKKKSKEEAQAELRKKLMFAMNNHGFCTPVHIRMANSAFDWSSFCCDDFPEDVFSPSVWTIENAFKRGFFDDAQKFNLEIEEEKKWNDFYVVITSTFTLEAANQHLFDKIPHYDELAIIIVDPKSVD